LAHLFYADCHSVWCMEIISGTVIFFVVKFWKTNDDNFCIHVIHDNQLNANFYIQYFSSNDVVSWRHSCYCLAYHVTRDWRVRLVLQLKFEILNSRYCRNFFFSTFKSLTPRYSYTFLLVILTVFLRYYIQLTCSDRYYSSGMCGIWLCSSTIDSLQFIDPLIDASLSCCLILAIDQVACYDFNFRWRRVCFLWITSSLIQVDRFVVSNVNPWLSTHWVHLIQRNTGRTQVDSWLLKYRIDEFFCCDFV